MAVRFRSLPAKNVRYYLKGPAVFRKSLYRTFEFLAFLPLAFLYKFDLLGSRSDNLIYKFRNWSCVEKPGRFAVFPTIRNATFVSAVAVVFVLMLAAGVSVSTNGFREMPHHASGVPTIIDIPSNGSSNVSPTRAIPVNPATQPVTSMLPVPQMAPVSFVNKLTHLLSAPKAPPGKMAVVTHAGQVVYVPSPKPVATVANSSFVTLPSMPLVRASHPSTRPAVPPSSPATASSSDPVPSSTWTHKPRHTYSPPPSTVPPSTTPPSPTPDPVPSPTVTLSPTPTVTRTPSATDTPTAEPTKTHRPKPHATKTPHPSPSGNSSNSVSDSPSPVNSVSPSASQ